MTKHVLCALLFFALFHLSGSHVNAQSFDSEDYRTSRLSSAVDENGVNLSVGTFCEPVLLATLRPQVDFDLTTAICTPINFTRPHAGNAGIGKIILQESRLFGRQVRLIILLRV